jgi:hypothetical protein
LKPTWPSHFCPNFNPIIPLLTYTVSITRQQLENVKEIMQQKAETRMAKRQKTMNGAVQIWLSPSDPSLNHKITPTAHDKNAAAWFFKGDVFNKWKSTPSLLWIDGKRMWFLHSTTPHLIAPPL